MPIKRRVKHVVKSRRKTNKQTTVVTVNVNSKNRKVVNNKSSQQSGQPPLTTLSILNSPALPPIPSVFQAPIMQKSDESLGNRAPPPAQTLKSEHPVKAQEFTPHGAEVPLATSHPFATVSRPSIPKPRTQLPDEMIRPLDFGSSPIDNTRSERLFRVAAQTSTQKIDHSKQITIAQIREYFYKQKGMSKTEAKRTILTRDKPQWIKDYGQDIKDYLATVNA